MKSIFVMFVLFVFMSTLVAQGNGGYQPEKDPMDPTSRRERDGHSFGGREPSQEHDASRDSNRNIGNSSLDPVETSEIAQVAVIAFECELGKVSPNTLAEKWSCFRETLAFKGLPTPEQLVAKFKDNPAAGKLFRDQLNWHLDADAFSSGPYNAPYYPETKTGLQVSPKDLGLTHCNFSAISTDGKSTDFRAANYNQVSTQQLVDNLRVIDPHAEIHFNDPKIVGVTPDNTPEHDGQVQVAWSSEPLSPAGMELLLESNPLVVRIFLELMPDKREEALEEYKAFDLTFAREYLKLGSLANFQAAPKALQEKEHAWKKIAEEELHPELDKCLKTMDDALWDAHIKKYQEKLSKWTRERDELLPTTHDAVLGYLKACDPIAIKAIEAAMRWRAEALQEKEHAWKKIAEEELRPELDNCLKTMDDALWDVHIKKYQEKLSKWTRERDELLLAMPPCALEGLRVEEQGIDPAFLIECAKNHDPVALVTALKTLEEKCCDPNEAQRRKECREAKAKERRKARYEAVKAKLEKEHRERYEAWLREQALRQQNSPQQGKGGGNHECYGDKCNGENWK